MFDRLFTKKIIDSFALYVGPVTGGQEGAKNVAIDRIYFSLDVILSTSSRILASAYFSHGLQCIFARWLNIEY